MLPRLAWGVLGYTVLVILWGAYVRATGSGAGCGDHWPLCNGVVVPRAPSVQTIIEFTHRLTSGLALVGTVALLWAARRFGARGHPVRAGAAWSLVFMVLEAVIGAGLVLFQWVADDPSEARVWAMGAHLVNTFLLLGALLFTALSASGEPVSVRLRGQGAVGWTVLVAVVGMCLLAVSGGVAALGDTLHPPQSLAHASQQHFAQGSPLLLRLRLFHPLVAIVVGLGVVAAAWTASAQRPSAVQRRWALIVSTLFGVQLAVGLLNVLLLAPAWMQLVHLLLADLVWLALLRAGMRALATQPAAASAPGQVFEPARG
jgi:cytochrome c oxidase assembly protein subunit 15